MKAEDHKYWTAFYTKPRSEKKVAERLRIKGFKIFCPVRTVLKQWSDRKKKVKEVLFNSYVFAYIDEFERQEILNDQGIVASVFWLKRPVRIPEYEIDSIKNFLNNHPSAKAEFLPSIGDQLTINSGPLRGEDGVVQKIKGNKIILSLQAFGITLSAEIPSSQLV